MANMEVALKGGQREQEDKGEGQKEERIEAMLIYIIYQNTASGSLVILH